MSISYIPVLKLKIPMAKKKISKKSPVIRSRSRTHGRHLYLYLPGYYPSFLGKNGKDYSIVLKRLASLRVEVLWIQFLT